MFFVRGGKMNEVGIYSWGETMAKKLAEKYFLVDKFGANKYIISVSFVQKNAKCHVLRCSEKRKRSNTEAQRSAFTNALHRYRKTCTPTHSPSYRHTHIHTYTHAHTYAYTRSSKLNVFENVLIKSKLRGNI